MSEHRPKIKSGYLHSYLHLKRLSRMVKKTAAGLKEYDFEGIAFRGVSGALIAPLVALKMEKSLLLVRKPTENCHSSRIVEGDSAIKQYVIVDDFVESGKTVRAIVQAISKFTPNAVCIGVVQTGNFVKGSDFCISDMNHWIDDRHRNFVVEPVKKIRRFRKVK